MTTKNHPTRESAARTKPAIDWDLDVDRTVDALNRILELELAGTVRYMHYSFMVFGPTRIPITAWLRAQATESLMHAQIAGEHITGLGGHPSLEIGELLETHKHSIGQILDEARAHETQALGTYRELLGLVRDRSVLLEEYVRAQIASEEQHLTEIAKMRRES